VTGSTSTTGQPGSGRPIEPGLTGAPGVLPTTAVISVCPNPSRRVSPQAFSTWEITSGLSGSPAAMTSRSDPGPPERSAWMSIRHTVGGAQNVVIPAERIRSSSAGASKRA